MDKKLMIALLNRAEDGNTILKILNTLSEITEEYDQEVIDTPDTEEILDDTPDTEEILDDTPDTEEIPVETPKSTRKRSRKENLVEV